MSRGSRRDTGGAESPLAIVRVNPNSARRGSIMSKTLWVVQGLLAVVFLFAGAVKLLTPPEVMAAQMALPIPIWFIQFISVCELLGAVGLILPAALKIRPGLTPLAAAGLVVIMIGATTD